jgi:hypothetical protein
MLQPTKSFVLLGAAHQSALLPPAGNTGSRVPQKHWLLFSKPANGNGGSKPRQKVQHDS